MLGGEPKSISGILPYSDPAENLSIWDELWQGKRLLWRGDGERLHVKLDGNAYVRYAAPLAAARPSPHAAGQMVDKLKVAAGFPSAPAAAATGRGRHLRGHVVVGY